jgi:hypothetical protein
MPDCGGVGKRCGFDSVPAPGVITPPAVVPMLFTSASITQSALPAICALAASKSTLLGVTDCAVAREAAAAAAAWHRSTSLVRLVMADPDGNAFCVAAPRL